MNPYYKIYLEDVCRLAATMSIKSEYAADKMNSKVSMMGRHVNYDDRKTWKYYMNLNGDYHATDVPMTVISMDTYEDIPFTKEFLTRHVLTKRTYVYGNKFYNDLISRYPTQETLIRGILNPIPYTTSIPADDHTILNYDRGLVEGNEQYLIPELQDLIIGCYDRWMNIDYTRVEPRYLEAFATIVYTNLVPWILLARKRKCFTNQVHSYHQRMYLLSFSAIGVEFDYMSHAQRLWFYRNIRYLNRNVGRQAIFDELVLKVLNDRSFPLSRYDLALDYENLIKDTIPEVIVNKRIEGRLETIYGSDKDSLAGAIDRERSIAKDNPAFSKISEEDVHFKMTNNTFGSMKTKMLESTIIDRADAEPFTLSTVMLNHWVYMSHIGLYNVKVPFNNPNTGESYLLDAFDAFVFYVYAVSRYYGTILTELPCVYVNRATREIPPTVEELLEATDPSLDLLPFIDYVFSKAVPIKKVESVITFRELCIDIHSASADLRDMRHLQNDFIMEGNLHIIIDRFFMGKNIHLGEGVLYSDWLAERDIFPETLRDSDLLEIANDIFSKVTGVTSNAGSIMKETHAAMLRIMGVLTSYSVQFVANVNENAIKVLDVKYPKMTTPSVDGMMTVNTRAEVARLQEMSFKGDSQIEIPITISELESVKSTGTVTHSVPAVLTVNAATSTHSNVPVGLQIPYFTIDKSKVTDLSTVDNQGELSIDYSRISNLPWKVMTQVKRFGRPYLNTYTHLTVARINQLTGE